MPANSTHTEYDASAGEWSRARDVSAGEDAVKAAGEKYLPRLDCQTDDEFGAYRKRASFFNATARTAEGYVGLMFRRPPFVKVPESSAGVGRGCICVPGERNDRRGNEVSRLPHAALRGNVGGPEALKDLAAKMRQPK